jgi:replicative DNA helicase
VAFLYAPKKADEDERYEEAMQKTFGKDWSRYPRRIDALVAKNRNGPSGKCELLFHRASTRFEDFNVWLKANGFKKSAAGERIPDLPTNDEMQL